MKPEQNEGLCHRRNGSIKISLCSKSTCVKPFTGHVEVFIWWEDVKQFKSVTVSQSFIKHYFMYIHLYTAYFSFIFLSKIEKLIYLFSNQTANNRNINVMLICTVFRLPVYHSNFCKKINANSSTKKYYDASCAHYPLKTISFKSSINYDKISHFKHFSRILLKTHLL